ncbi:MAG: hypothetical protein A4E57_04826 [Syntrophorhabdaceae bacterium PtaU1.Bin034]|nr:MAG: hypothetical protein A4E57_04826 [Syntrophorhabdaceae bacterium PtaU1.Bin034]
MKKAKTSHKGRICKFPKCKNVLSIYNHETYCHIHLNCTGAAYKKKA